MPHFQPGQGRYFGTTPRPASSITTGLFGGRGITAPPSMSPTRYPVRMRAAKPKPYTIGQSEQKAITQKLLKMPHYIPSATTKGLKDFAKRVLAQKDAYTKEEVVFATATKHHDRPIARTEKQKAYIEGEVEALVAIEDRHIKQPFAFTHRTKEVAGQTLRTLVKERRASEQAPSVRDRRSNALKPRFDKAFGGEAPPSVSAPLEPTPLGTTMKAEDGSATAGWDAPFAPKPLTSVAANTVHADHASPTPPVITTSALAAMIVSNRLTDVAIASWSVNLRQRLGHIPGSTLPLIRAFPTKPPVLLLDGTAVSDPQTIQSLGIPVVVFAEKPLPSIRTAWEAVGASFIRHELDEEALRAYFAPAT